MNDTLKSFLEVEEQEKELQKRKQELLHTLYLSAKTSTFVHEDNYYQVRRIKHSEPDSDDPPTYRYYLCHLDGPPVGRPKKNKV